MSKENEGPGYTARLASAALGDSHGPRESAEAEEITNRTRESTGPGRWRAMEERLDAQHARMLEQANAFHEAQRNQLELQRQRLDQEFEETKKKAEFILEQLRGMFTVGNAAVTLAYENVERARTAAEILTREPPPRSTSTENATEFGKHLVSVIGELAGKVIDRDPAAQQKLQELTHQMLGIAPGLAGKTEPEAAASPPVSESAPAAPAPQREPSRPAAPPPPELKVADLLAVTRLVPEAKVNELAVKLGVPASEVPLRLLLPLAEEARKAQRDTPRPEEPA